MKPLSSSLIFVSCCLLMIAPVLLNFSASAGGEQREIDAIAKQIRNVYEAKDSVSLRALATRAKEEWAKKTNSEYHRLIVVLCLSLNSLAPAETENYNVIRSLAFSVIDSAKNLPPDVSSDLLILLQADRDYAKGELKDDAWAKERLIRTRRWLKTWESFRKELAAMPKVLKRPVAVARPPEETRLPSGIDPSEINDPVLRLQYEQAIEKVRRASELYNIWRRLPDIEQRFAKSTRSYIIEAYCKPPYRTDEIEPLLEECGVDKDTRLNIASEVRKRITQQMEHDKTHKVAPKMVITPPKDPPGPGAHHADPRLRKRVTINVAMPKVDAALEKLGAATGVRFTFAGIQNERPAVNGIFVNGVPAWEVMDAFAADKKVAGRWEKDGDGYRLVPSQTAVAVPPDLPETPLAYLWQVILGMGALLTVAGAGIAFFFWRRARAAR